VGIYQKLVPIFIKTDFNLLSILCLLPENILLLGFYLQKFVQIDRSGGKHIIQESQRLLWCIPDRSDATELLYVIIGGEVEHVDFLEEEVDLGKKVA
jgi:hypothetical protein